MAQVMNFDEPVTLYRGGETRPVHSKKQYDEALQEGFTTRYTFQEFPKIVYHDDGTYKRVHSKQEEAAHLKEGFSLTAHDDQRHLDRPKIVKEKDPSKREAALETENGELKERLTDLEGKFQELLDALNQKSKPARGKKATDKPSDDSAEE